MGRSPTDLPSAIIAAQDCPKLRGEEACQCKLNGEDISSHGRLLGGSPTPTADPTRWQCPFMLEDGRQCAFACQKSKPCDMARHQTARHTPYRKFSCDMCGKKFNQHEHMTVHRRTHFKDQKDKCPYEDCTFEFTDPSSLARHKAAKHPNEKALRPNKRKRAGSSTQPTSSAPEQPALEQPISAAAPPALSPFSSALEQTIPPTAPSAAAHWWPALEQATTSTAAPALTYPWPDQEQEGPVLDGSGTEATVASGNHLDGLTLPEWQGNDESLGGSEEASSSPSGGEQTGVLEDGEFEEYLNYDSFLFEI